MCAALRNDLEWEETSCDFSSRFLGKELVECVVYQDEDVSAWTIGLGMTLADRQGNQDVVKLRACSYSDDPKHEIIHAFLSDPTTGCVVKDFPLHREILGVSSVRREEKGRSWSCCGHAMDDGCFVSGLKFTFGSSEHVILHCWTQCQPVPFCGDPHSPSYVPGFRVLEFGELQGKRSSFLPPDFLGHIGCGDGFCPFDATGMLLAGTSRGKSMRYSTDVFDSVKLQFGLGQWAPGPFWKFREAYSGQRVIQLCSPESRSALSLGLGSFFPVEWKETFKKVQEGLDDCILLHGKYDIDLWQMQPSRIMSKELNAAVDMLSPSLTFPVTMSHLILSKLLCILTGAPEKQAISVRFTNGNSLGGLDGMLASPPGSFKSRVQHGCQGGSLGFHLVESSEMRKVITLHGSVEDLISDLEQTCAGAELEHCQGLIRDGKASQVLGMRCGRGEEVMSMRISNPSVQALIGCSMIMPDGQVQYDPKTKAFYPITWNGGNVRRDAACALILGILKAMKACKDSLDLIPGVIRMRSVS